MLLLGGNMRHKISKPSKLVGIEGLLKKNTNAKPVFTSIVGTETPQSQPLLEVLWHTEGKITPELKRVFAMLLRGRK